MALVNRSILHYMFMKKFLKNLLLRNRWLEFRIISQDCSLCDLCKILIRQKNPWLPWGRLFALCGLQRNSPKFFSTKTACQISKSFHRNVPWVTLFKNCSRNFDLCINMALANGGHLHCTNI